MNTDKHGFMEVIVDWSIRKSVFLSLFICAHLWLISSCGSKPTDPRTVIPADVLVYLETNDLGKALTKVTDNDAFKNAAKTMPDFSSLNGIKLAVAVTGFETKEEQLTEENSVLNFQPRFVAVAETNAWNYQALSFAENKLGEFINEVYGGEVNLESYPKYDGKYFVWTAQDGRRAYGLVIDSLIFFGNDESAIEKCVSTRRGETDSISKNTKLPTGDFLSSGYVSPDGIAQLANIVGIQLAQKVADQPEVQSAIAGIIPQLLRNSITEISWTAAKAELGIEDKLLISLKPEVSKVLNETLVPGDDSYPIDIVKSLVAKLPPNLPSVTRYNFKDPQIAWRSILFTAQKLTDGVSGKIIGEFASLLFEPYGIRDPELCLSAVGESRMGRNIITAKLDYEGEETVVIITRGDKEKQILKTLTEDLKPPKQIVEGGTNLWSSDNDELQLVFDGDGIGIGSKENLKACLFWTAHVPEVEATSESMRFLVSSKAPVVTVFQDLESTQKIAEVLAERKSDQPGAVRNSITETRFNQNGIERRTVSDFGLIGSIIEQFGKE